MDSSRSPYRFPLMALAIIALSAAMWAGLARLGWSLPPLRPTLPVAHGPLMVSGFLGTLIALERAVALERRWAYVAPLLTGVGSLILVVGVTDFLGPLLITLGSLAGVAIFAVIISRHPMHFTAVMGLGAFTWMVGNLLWLVGEPIYRVVFWWVGFLVLTIAGERLELSRLRHLSPVGLAVFLGSVGLFLAGLILSGINSDAGARLSGAGMILLAMWLFRHDIARRTIRQAGLTRFIAISLLTGYLWLVVAGVLGLVYGGISAGPRYDAVLHALFLGFVFAMIFGHAPIIFPAVLGVPIAFRSSFYLHLILLHVSLLIRIIGDVAVWLPGRRWGGLLNVVALLFFLANTARSLRRKPQA